MIRKGLLSDLFVGVVAKKLTLVETITPKSNQHEFQGTKPLKNLFGMEDRRGIQARFIWLAEEQAAISEDGFLSWSNVRKGKPRAPEFHLYYSSNAVTEAMQPEDTMFLAIRPEGSALVVIAPAASTMQSQLLWLFGMSEQHTFGFEYRDIEHARPAELDFAARYILDELGIEFEEPEAGKLDALLERFGMEFPTTRAFSELARTSLPLIDARDDADKVLMAWIEQEELLFRRLERRIVAERLRSGFMVEHQADVDGFLKFSLSVQNRRKSRAGQSLENHLEALFTANKIRFSRGAETENRNRPDFLFPGKDEYQSNAFPQERLTMLGAKSTLKDRWRQVLAEARRIERKHLVTIEPGISEAQTDQMQSEKLQLVIPTALQVTFHEKQRSWLLSLSDFMKLVTYRQTTDQ
jgi:hypothetical protein